MKKKENRIFMLLTIAAIMCLFGLTSVQAQTASSFSGRAQGVNANVSVVGAPAVNTTIADTGQLPSTGGSQTGGALTGTVVLGPGNSLTTGALDTTTSGSGNSSQSQASVATLNSSILGIPITANIVRSNSDCFCTATGPSCIGRTTIANLVINGVPIDTTGNLGPITLLGGLITVFINEQTNNGAGDITVTALRISINSPGVLVANIIIAQSHSDIACSTTAASAVISGRVLTPKGRGLPRATVVLTDQNGEIKYTVTNSQGYYRFADVEVGGNYFLSVRSKRYIFTTHSLFVTEDLADIDFMPTP